MKAEVSLNARYIWSSANLGGGFAPNLANPAVYPSEESNVSYPMQKDCDTQGRVTSLYYAYSKDLKNSGAAFATATSFPINDPDQGIVQFRGVLAQPIAAGVSVGSIKFTWYVRFHGRTKRAGIVSKTPLMNFASKFESEEKENQDPQEDVSQMSYAELQAQVKSMLRK